jgi:hypothetical protein
MPGKGKEREKSTRMNLVTGVDTLSSQTAQNPATSRRLQSLIPSLAGDLVRELPDPTYLSSLGSKVGFLFDYNKSNGDGTNTHFYFAATSTQLFLSVNGAWVAQSLPLKPDPPATPSTTPLTSFPQAVVMNNMMHISDGKTSWIFDGITWLLEGFPIPLVGPTFTVQNNVFTGAGLNDVTFSGPYTGVTQSTFTVIIDGTGTPDTFKWQKDSGAFTTGVAITGAAQTLQEGVKVKFNATTGHTLGNQWVTVATPNFNIATNRYYWYTWADETVGPRIHESTSSPGIGGGVIAQPAGNFGGTPGSGKAPGTAGVAGSGIAWSNPNNIKVSDASYATAVLAPPGQQTQGPSTGNNPSQGNIGNPWNNLSNVEVQDGVAAYSVEALNSSSDNTTVLQLLGFGFNIPPGSTINGIVATVYRWCTRAGSGPQAVDAVVKLVQNGSIGGTNHASASLWPSGNTATTYGASNDSWGFSGGNAWTPALINSPNFGIAIQVQISETSGVLESVQANIDYIALKIYYTPTGGISQELQATNFGINIPGSASIVGIQVDVQRAKTAGTGTIQDNDVTLLKGGVPINTNKASASAWPGAEAYASYGNSSDLWGTTWQPSDINGGGFGVQLSAIETTGNSSTAGVDFIDITVWYSTTQGTGPVSIGVIIVTMPLNPPARTNHIHLYASESENSQIGFFLASIPVATTTYTDSSPFIGATNSIFQPIERPVRNDPPVPSKIQEVHKYRIFRRRETKPSFFNFTANEEVAGGLNGSAQESTPGTDPNTQSDIVNEQAYPNQSLGIRGIVSHGDACYFATEKDITPMYGQSIDSFTLSQITAFKIGLAGRYAFVSTPHGMCFVSYDKKVYMYPSQWAAGFYGTMDSTSTLVEIGRPMRNVFNTILSSDLDNVRLQFYNYNKRNWLVLAFQDNTSNFQTWVYDFETQGWFQLQRGVSSLATFEFGLGSIVLMGADTTGQVYVLDDLTGTFSSTANLPSADFRPALIDWNAPDHYHVFKYVEFETNNALIGSASMTINYWLDPLDVDNPGSPTGTLNISQVKGSNFFRCFPQPGTLCYRLLLEFSLASDRNSGDIRGLNIVADEASSLIF